MSHFRVESGAAFGGDSHQAMRRELMDREAKMEQAERI